MKKLKQFLGILLIAAAVLGLGFWEVRGRSMVLTDDVLVAVEEIRPGTVITSSNVGVRGVLQDDMIADAMTPEEFKSIEGSTASEYIPANGQISKAYIMEDNGFVMGEGESIYSIDGDWISMKSSSLRRGDRVGIYNKNTMASVGEFKVAFVKDDAGREVTNAEVQVRNRPLDRTESTSVIESMEIICTLDDYNKIVRIADAEKTAADREQRGQEPCLVCVQLTDEEEGNTVGGEEK